MTPEEIREYHEASPFVPFTLRLSSGRALTVEHPEFMHVPPVGSQIVVWSQEGYSRVVDASAVEEIDLSPLKKPPGRKRRR